MSGGTGGHIYPALAVADYLREKDITVLWLGTKTGLEAQVVPEAGLQLLTTSISGLRGKGMVRWLLAPFLIFITVCQAILILIKYRPVAVLGMGGFASAPGGVAAWLMRIPLCVHEQNAIAGLTNRLLAPLAHTIMQAFPNTFAKSVKARTTGNPVRRDIIESSSPEQRFKERADDRLRLLVVGGSLGSQVLNKVVPETLSILKGEVHCRVKHQTGSQHLEPTRLYYQSLNITAELEPYFKDMATVYAWADLVLCRAGAMTIAELTATGVASILIPYPYAVDDHQLANARYLSDRDAAILILEADFSAANLAVLLKKLFVDRAARMEMANLCLSLSRPAATRQVADLFIEAANARI